MKTAKTCLLQKPKGDFIVSEFPIPNPEPGTILMQIEYCGVCGTDVHTWQCEDVGWNLEYPISLGHEIVGTVAKLGPGVNADYIGHPLKIGDRIGVIPAVHCHKCYFCTIAKTPEKCINWKTYGTWSNADKEPYFNGGYGEYLYISDPNSVVLKMGTTAERGVFLEPMAVVVHAMLRANIKPGDTVVVQGAGPIGLLTVACAKLCGASRVIAIESKNLKRLELSKKMGADLAISHFEFPELKGRRDFVFKNSINLVGADVVFNAVGSPTSFKECLQYVRNSGTFVEIGNFVDSGTCEINPCKEILEKNISIMGSFDNEAEHFVRALPIISNEKIPITDLISHRLPLTDVQRVHEVIKDNRKLDGEEIVKVLIDPRLK